MNGPRPFEEVVRVGGAARLLTRLAPKSMPRMPGQGGIPSLTPQDIAAALGLAARGRLRDRMAVEVLCLRHWPEAFEGPQVRRVPTPPMPATEAARAADTPEAATDRKRVSRRRKPPVPTLAARVAACRRGVDAMEYPRKQRLIAFVAARARRHAQQRMAGSVEVAAALGPKIAQDAFWEALARAVLAEYAQPNPCPTCKGLGQRLRLRVDANARSRMRAELALCETCHGAGAMAWSYKRRAKAVQVRAEFYRVWVNALHTQEVALLREMEREGLRRFAACLYE